MKLVNYLKYITILLSTWFIIHQVIIISDGLTDTYTKQNYCVIFGNKVNEDGSLSPRLKSRVDRGLELYNQGIVERIFVSGGLGSEGHYEGDKMAEYLISNGVDKEDVEKDNQGVNSRATALNFRDAHPEIDSLIVISQFYHITRAKLAFKQLGFRNVESASSDYFEVRDIYSLVREFFGYYKYYFLY